MSVLFAKVKKNRQDVFKKVLSNLSCLYETAFTRSVDYSIHRLLEDGEWYKLTDFTENYSSLPLFTSDLTQEYDRLELDDFAYVELLIYHQDNMFYIQKNTKSKRIRKKIISFIADNYAYDENAQFFQIKNSPDLIYNKNNDILYFSKIETLISIFPDTINLYREASEEEVRCFFSIYCSCGDNFNKDNIGKRNLKLLANSLPKIKFFAENNLLNAFFEYVRTHFPNITISDNKVIISDNKELKSIFDCINEKYYITSITEENRCANSSYTFNQEANQDD